MTFKGGRQADIPQTQTLTTSNIQNLNPLRKMSTVNVTEGEEMKVDSLNGTANEDDVASEKSEASKEGDVSDDEASEEGQEKLLTKWEAREALREVVYWKIVPRAKQFRYDEHGFLSADAHH